MQRERDREDASRPGNIPNGQGAEVRLDAVPGDGQAEAQACPVGSVLSEWREHRLHRSKRKSAATVMHLDDRVSVRCGRPQRDFRVRVRELEGILKQVAQGRMQHGPVAPDGHVIRYRRHAQCAARGIRLEPRGALGVLDEGREGEDRPLRLGNGTSFAKALCERLPEEICATGGLVADADRFMETLVMCDGVGQSRQVVGGLELLLGAIS